MKKELIKNEALEAQMLAKEEELNSYIVEWNKEKLTAETAAKAARSKYLTLNDRYIELLKENAKSENKKNKEEFLQLPEVKVIKNTEALLIEEENIQYLKIQKFNVCIKAAKEQLEKITRVKLNNIVALNKEFFINTPAHYKKFKDALKAAYPGAYFIKNYGALEMSYKDTEAYLYIYNGLYGEKVEEEKINSLEEVKTINTLNKKEIETEAGAIIEDIKKIKAAEEALKSLKDELDKKHIKYSGLYIDDIAKRL